MWNDDNDFNTNEGGGFDNTTNMFQSPASQQAKSSNKPRAIAPVTIKQVLDSQGEGLTIKEIDVQMVRIVGIVKGIDVSSIKVSYTVEDATGSIVGISYLENDSEENSYPVPVVENTYCVLTGIIRTQSEVKHIMVFNIYPVTNFNEILEHYLAVIHMSLKAEQIPANIPEKSDLKQDMVASYGDTNGRNESSTLGSIDVKYRKVYEAIMRATSDSGINIDEIRTIMTVKMPVNQIRAALDYLVNEGHIFTTIDDNHFKSTESAC